MAASAIALPEAVAKGRQAKMEADARKQKAHQAIIGGVIQMERSIAADIYARTVANEYHLRAMTAVKQAEDEASKYGDEPDTIGSVPVKVDINGLAKLSIEAADCLLCHLGLIDSKGQIKLPPDEPAAPVADEQTTGGIILG